MKAIILFLAILFTSTISFADETVMGNQPTVHRGAAFTLQQSVTLDEVANKAQEYAQKTVLIKGKVSGVCQAKGCWMTISGDQATSKARITFKDYGFFVPFDVKGKDALVEGVVQVKELSEAERNHLAQDAKKPVAEIPKVELRIIASAVELSQVVSSTTPTPAPKKEGHDCGEH